MKQARKVKQETRKVEENETRKVEEKNKREGETSK